MILKSFTAFQKHSLNVFTNLASSDSVTFKSFTAFQKDSLNVFTNSASSEITFSFSTSVISSFFKVLFVKVGFIIFQNSLLSAVDLTMRLL